MPRSSSTSSSGWDGCSGPRCPTGSRSAASRTRSAALRRRSLLAPRCDLVLTIGLPLAAALSVRELAAVLAHELGHFSQRSGMGLIRLICSIDGWFHRSVHGRDAFDEGLERAAEDTRGAISLVLVACVLTVRACRALLAAFLVLERRVAPGLTLDRSVN